MADGGVLRPEVHGGDADGRPETPQGGSSPPGKKVGFRELIDSLPAAVYTTDSNGRATYLNPAAAALAGREPGPVTDAGNVNWKLFRADGSPLQQVEIAMEIALAEGREVRGEEVVLERPDGTRIRVEPYPTPILDDGGRIIGGVNMLVDVTERKRGEEARARLAAIVECSDDAIISKDLDGIITSWNRGAERLFGYSAEEAVGKHVTLLIPEDRYDEEPGIIARIRQGEPIDHYETIRRRKDGTLLHISLSVSPLRDAKGRIVGASKIARDITERKRAEEALREADRRKNEFLATLAHELRNPLAPIRNSLHILRLAGTDPSANAEIQDVLERQVNHMVRLVDDLLEISRINTGKIDLRPEPVEIASVVRSAVETSMPLIDAGGHRLTTSLPPEPLTVMGDPVRLSQVVANLLNNAAKYTEPGGKIQLTVRREGNEATVSVRDTGIGIPAPMLDRVFEMFTQVDRAERLSQNGLGIGLALARRLLQLHGGRIEVRSAGEGQGSEFIIHLPLAARQMSLPPGARPRGQSEKAIDPNGPPHTGPDSHPPRTPILVVDDNRDAATSLAMLLRVMGGDVRTVNDGPAALRTLEGFSPALVLLDLGMPEMDGYEVARRIRALTNTRDLVLVALTGWGQDEDRRRTREAGFDRHLVKPVSFDSLQELLADLRGGRLRHVTE